MLRLARCRVAVKQQGASRRYTLAAAEKVNVLLLGSGGREHALAWKISQSELCGKLFCAPGNPGIADERNVLLVPEVDASDHEKVASFCTAERVGLVVIGPEAPLVDGLADSLRAADIHTFGPSRAAAQLEGSKTFMKDLCARYGIPTAAWQRFTDAAAAKAYARGLPGGAVIKASGLAAGKGVTVARGAAEADAAIDAALRDRVFGDAGSEIIVEEVLEGEEVSFFALVDGSTTLALASAQDHKAAFDGDAGPNTGGMGAYSPAPALTAALQEQVMRDIVQRTADAMVAEGKPFQGVLFAGLMVEGGRAKLLEHNVRFGDPECQCLMVLLQADLLELLLAASRGRLGDVGVRWSDGVALTVVMAARGYPGAYRQGTEIRGLGRIAGARVFHAGTSRSEGGALVAAGGRVLGVTACGGDVREAQERAYAAVAQVDWPEGFYRSDIGWRAVGRRPES